jgi:hypothetical protein
VLTLSLLFKVKILNLSKTLDEREKLVLKKYATLKVSNYVAIRLL